MSFFDRDQFETMAYGQCFDLYTERKWNLERCVNVGDFAANAMNWTSETLETPEKAFSTLLSLRFGSENEMEWTSSLEEERSVSIHDMVMGDMTHEELVFVLVDSCAFYRKTIEQYLDELRSEYKDGTRFVVVKSCTSFIENNYKIVRSENYKNVDFDILSRNLSTLGQLAFGANKTSLPSFEMLAIPAEFEFQLYHLELVNHFEANYRVFGTDQRQMNDNIQIELVCAIATTVSGSQVVMVTEDKLMQKLLDNKREELKLSIDIRDVAGNYM
jgi:hypothetical protein